MPFTPRPILKRASSHPPYDEPSLKPRDPHPVVHFPPNPSLTRTFSAYSSAAYDRSPIIVTPNSCALPERGCPGRTYVLDDDTPSISSRHSPSIHRSPMAASGHLHPKALSRRKRTAPGYVESCSSDGMSAVPSSLSLPALIPDCTSSSSSSSSESDESDSCSHQSQHSQDSSSSHSTSHHHPSSPKYSRTLHGLVIPESQSKSRSTSDTLAFLPHPPSPPDAHHVRRASASARSSSPSSSKSSRRSLRDVTVVEDDTSYHETVSRHTRYSRTSSYSALSKPLSGMALQEEDLGCLAGF